MPVGYTVPTSISAGLATAWSSPITTTGAGLPPKLRAQYQATDYSSLYQAGDTSGFKMRVPPSIVFTPTVNDVQYEASVRELGQELADKLAIAREQDITREELGRRFPNTQADIQTEINQLDRIASAQRLEKVRPMTPAETTITQNGVSWNCVGTKCEAISQPAPASSVFSILPFVIIGILALVFILIWRAR